MNPAVTSTTGTNGESALHELFALSDEQILDIAPESTDSARVGQPFLAVQERRTEAATRRPSQSSSPDRPEGEITSASDQLTGKTAQPEMAVPQEPPPWLAAQMQDPWSGEEAREFWNGVQQARTEAAACQVYRAAIASPEDARALKELYPSGVNEARTAAERARLLDEVDRAYFGGAGNSPEQTAAARAQLAQQLLREDPAAFREMVETGIRILQGATEPQNHREKTMASVVSDTSRHGGSAVPPASSVVAQHAVPLQRDALGEGHTANASVVGAQQAAPQLGSTSTNEAHVATYAAFERAANEDLERSVGGAIERTLAQALPVAQPLLAVHGVNQAQGQGAQARVPALQQRLSAAIRQDVEEALQGDRQLGEQVAQILASRRFDNDARAQVVRLISERAQQLVPGAAKRVLNDWTQTTLAAHRSRTQRAEASASIADVAPASSPARASQVPRDTRRQDASATNSRRVDYRKFSDEQILDMS